MTNTNRPIARDDLITVLSGRTTYRVLHVADTGDLYVKSTATGRDRWVGAHAAHLHTAATDRLAR